MAFYHRLGEIPRKRHIQFRQPDGSLYKEELVSSHGFSGIYSNLYHKYSPTEVKEVLKPESFEYKLAKDQHLLQTHLNTSKVERTGKDFLDARQILLKNNDVAFGLCNPSEQEMDYFYKNGEADEVIFVHDGSGTMTSQQGVLNFKQGDYIVIPRTVIYKMKFDTKETRLLVIESASPIETPSRYRNDAGQLAEHSPFCERDLHPPRKTSFTDEKGEFLIKIKKQGMLHRYVYAHNPMDVVGWDGYLFPYIFSIHDFEPITGRIHQPPPVHQTFQAQGFVICSFVPRLFDYHPESIPAPYNHSNIDSDEVLYYVEGNFMSRKGIDRGSFTLHPGGLPHGPHPGTAEKSIGEKETHELAVMIDTFRPLMLTEAAEKYVDKKYPMSWNAH